MEPTFTIVTPSLRMLPWLKLCAASVADQIGVSAEHIVQDGGTGPALVQWAEEHPAIRCYQEPDQGMYDAINRGFKRGRGRICAFLNCDEQYLPATLQKVERFFAEHPRVDVVFGDVLLVDTTGAPVSYRRVVLPKRIHTRLSHLCTATCATFFRRSVIERGFLFDPHFRVIGDAVWIHRLLEHKVPMARLNEPLAVYTFTGSNLSETARTNEELAEWRRQAGAPPAWMRGPTVLWHRLQKLAAGAYLPRRMSYAIYTFTSPARRVPFELSGIRFGWPGATAPSVPPRDRHDLSSIAASK